MIALGEQLALRLPTPSVVFLEGNLGAGKTTLTKGIVKGLGAAAAEDVSSPTFTLIHEYGNPTRVYHIDLYRLDEPRELATLGLDDIFDQPAVVVIEWPEKFASWLPRDPIRIQISSHNDTRTVRMTMPAHVNCRPGIN